MKKFLLLGSFALGILFLAACAQTRTIQKSAPSIPQTPEPSVPISCTKLTEFSNYPWSNSLETLYKSEFLKKQGVEGELWTGEIASGCKIGDLFVFIPEFFEFGCGRILKYDTVQGILIETAVQPPTACADTFGHASDSSIEYFGWQGDAGEGAQFHGLYYFLEDRIGEIPSKTFTNQKYGYTLEMPETWGAISPYAASYTSDLYDELEILGPDLHTDTKPEIANSFFIDIEVFSDENTAREPKESWTNFYARLRLDGVNSESQKLDETTTEVTIKNDDNSYRKTCRIIEHNNMLYSFCFDNQNDINKAIIQSLSWND